jgi:pilus assembly protein CpaE
MTFSVIPKLHSQKEEVAITSLIGVLGSKGGVGATTLAINLAASFSTLSTTLIDANLQQPDAALLLAKEPQFSLLDLILRRAHLDEQVFEACSTEVAGTSKVRLITPPADGHAGAKMTLTDLADTLPDLTRFTNRVIIDLPRHLDRHLVTTLDALTMIVLVVEPTFASIASAKRLLSTFDDLGYDRQKVQLVVNRFGGKLKYIDDQLATSFQGHDYIKVPNVYAISETCAIEGVPIVLKHSRDSYAKAVKALAVHLDQRAKLLLENENRAPGISITTMPQA